MNEAEKNVLRATIFHAATAAYNEDADMMVGRDSLGNWCYRHIEDPTALYLRERLRVCGDGVHPDYRAFYKKLIGEQ